MTARKKSSPRPPAPFVLTTESRLALLTIALFILVRGIVGLVDTEGLRLWGLDFYAALDAGWVGIVLWLPLIFVLPPVARILGGNAGSGDGGSGGKTALRLLAALLLTAVCGLLAWQVNVGYAFLGDGTWYPAELLRSMTLPDYANSMIKPSAWLTGLLMDFLAVHFQPTDIRLPFIVAGVLGAVTASGALFFLMLRERGSTVLLAALLLLGSTGSLIFLGYIELYAIVYGLSIAYLISAWESFRGAAPVWLPGVFLLAAVLFGATAVVWLPSYLLLLHWKKRGEEGSFPLRRAAWLLMLLPLAGVVLLYLLTGTGSDNAYLVALSPYERMVDGLSTGWQRYVFFAPERWWDILNVLFLTLGGILLLLPLLLFLALRKRLLTLPAVLFALVASSGGLTLLLFGNTFLGLARDWDVAAFAVLGCLLLALVLMKSLHARGGLQIGAVLPAVSAVVLSQLLLWVAVNTDEEASAERFAQIASMDEGLILPMNSFTAWENLRKFHRSGGDQGQYFKAMRRLIATGYRRDVSYAEYLSAILQLKGHAKRAEEMAWLLSTLRTDAEREHNLGNPTVPMQFFREFSMRALLSAWQVGQQELVLQYRPVFASLFSSWPEEQLLFLLQQEVSATDANSMLEKAVSDDTGDAFLLMTAGGLYARYGMYGKAQQFYDRALEREPTTYPSWYLVAARLQLEQLDNSGKARQYLHSCIQNAPSSTEAQTARDMLSRLP